MQTFNVSYPKMNDQQLADSIRIIESFGLKHVSTSEGFIMFPTTDIEFTGTQRQWNEFVSLNF